MSTTITIPETLEKRIWDAAQQEGYYRTEDYIFHIIEEKLLDISDKLKIIQITNRVRNGLAAKGISEKNVIKDFENIENIELLKTKDMLKILK